MVLAAAAGIHVFATGGIGGVHRGAELSFDVSADLLELGRTPVTVVCAGVKSILDIPKTLEVLETQGVPVVGFKTATFPAFFTNSATPLIDAPLRVDTPKALARMIQASLSLGMRNGMVVAVPNPQPHPDPAALETCIADALTSAEKEGVRGAAITPYLLAKVERLTGGSSLTANVALYLNNARVAADVAVELAALRSSPASAPAPASASVSASASSPTPKPAPQPQPQVVLQPRRAGPPAAVVVVGGAACDVVATVSPGARFHVGSSNPGSASTSFGGVARNISERLAGEFRSSSSSSSGSGTELGVALCSAVGADSDGAALLSHCAAAGVDVSLVVTVSPAPASAGDGDTLHKTQQPKQPSQPTARYVAVHGPDGDLVASVADMAVLRHIDESIVTSLGPSIRTAGLVVVDGNITQQTLRALCRVSASYAVPVFFEPTSDHKCTLPLSAGCFQAVDVLKPNVSELAELVKTLVEGSYGPFSSSAAVSSDATGKRQGRGQESEYGQYIRNRTAVSRSLESVFKSLKDDTGAVDLVDVRVLAHALVGVLAGAAQGPAPDATSEGRPRLIRHKHVLVSMGKLGVLWAAETAAFNKMKPDRTAASRDVVAQSADGLVSSLHVACEPLPPGASVNTNGGGDAFCAGFIAGIFAEGGVSVAAIQRGHAAARKQCLKI